MVHHILLSPALLPLPLTTEDVGRALLLEGKSVGEVRDVIVTYSAPWNATFQIEQNNHVWYNPEAEMQKSIDQAALDAGDFSQCSMLAAKQSN